MTRLRDCVENENAQSEIRFCLETMVAEVTGHRDV